MSKYSKDVWKHATVDVLQINQTPIPPSETHACSPSSGMFIFFLVCLEAAGSCESAHRLTCVSKSAQCNQKVALECNSLDGKCFFKQRTDSQVMALPLLILSAASSKEPRSGSAGCLLGLEMTARLKWSGFSVKAKRRVWIFLYSQPNTFECDCRSALLSMDPG